MKSVQFIIHFTNGDTLTGDVVTLENTLHELRKEKSETTMEEVEKSTEEMIELAQNLGEMRAFSLYVDHAIKTSGASNIMGINPANVNYIETRIR